MSNIELTIHKYIIENFNYGTSFDINENLLQSEIIDSLGLINLIAFLEKQFSVKVELEKITPENFMTVSAIADFVKKGAN